MTSDKGLISSHWVMNGSFGCTTRFNSFLQLRSSEVEESVALVLIKYS